MNRTGQLRQQTGQAITALIAGVGVFVILALGLLAFEISRYALAQEQLKNCVDAAALAGQATLAMYSPTSSTDSLMQTGFASSADAMKAQASAAKAAYKVFCQNSILGHSLTTSTMPAGAPNPSSPAPAAPNPLPQPTPNQASVYIEFVSPSAGANSSAPNTSCDQKIIKVSAAYGVVPAFGQFLGIPSVPAINIGTAAIPMIDVMNVFDVSGAVDDQTNVTFVKRIWVNSAGYTSTTPRVYVTAPHVDYVPVTSSNGTIAEGAIAQILGNPIYGTNVNALPPQGLENANTAPTPLRFSEAVPASRLLRGVTNTGSPPGNMPGQVVPPSTPPSTNGNDLFTDMVVNLDGNTHFAGFTTPNGYAFPNVAVLVEAARGNLETPATFAAARLAGNPLFAGIVPRPGYKALGYEYNAALALKPFAPARTAALNFGYTLLHTNNCQMGEISYNDHVGSTDLSTFNAPNISSVYPQGDYPIPGAFLLPNQYEEPVTDQLFGMYKQLCTSAQARVWGLTSNVGAALKSSGGGQQSSIDWLTNSTYHRPNADRAIVLFTNTAPAPSELAAARSAATAASNQGIPIYVVGLAENPNTQSVQNAAYSDTAGSGGICALAGHGSRFFQITNEADLPQTFGNVLRQLVKLAKTS